jgi:hypothetical protein
MHVEHSIKVWNHLRSTVLPLLSPQAGQDACSVNLPVNPDNMYLTRCEKCIKMPIVKTLALI